MFRRQALKKKAAQEKATLLVSMKINIKTGKLNITAKSEINPAIAEELRRTFERLVDQYELVNGRYYAKTE
ncbi:hypothetical protein BSK59_08330 [Paenibacillus odorifer]|uniref:hypothetical protein n=1 Tax=Paenibacillus TaxID=44249 RepID=UPI00096D492F|nr:hypothetical protein [Paenibacillus odorifer]OME58181.1 hypothetical protein BSK59_08330 [Paenibacillus odorifer]